MDTQNVDRQSVWGRALALLRRIEAESQGISGPASLEDELRAILADARAQGLVED